MSLASRSAPVTVRVVPPPVLSRYLDDPEVLVRTAKPVQEPARGLDADRGWVPSEVEEELYRLVVLHAPGWTPS